MKTLEFKMLGVKHLSWFELKKIDGGTTCPSMTDYYSAAYSGLYFFDFFKGVFKGFINAFN